jgi:hypothetical protein
MFGIEGRWDRQENRFLEILVFIHQINSVTPPKGCYLETHGFEEVRLHKL